MKRIAYIVASLLLFAASVSAGNNVPKYVGVTSTGVPFASLFDSTKVPQADGTIITVTGVDGSATTCAAGSATRIAQRIDGAWICNPAGGSGAAIPDPLQLNQLLGTGTNPAISNFSVNGVINVVALGADPTGVTGMNALIGGTQIWTSIVNAACPSRHCVTPIYFPPRSASGQPATYVWTAEANMSNLDGLTIFCGGGSQIKDVGGNTGAIVTLQATGGGSNGFDFSGDSNLDIEGCRFMSSPTVHAQTMLALFGKITSGVNPTANPGRVRDSEFISYQPYNVYNYGFESVNWDNDKWTNYYNTPALTVTSCTEPSSNTARCVTSAAHGLTGGERVLFTGISVDSYDGLYPVTKINNTTLQYTITSNGLGTGSGGAAQPAQPEIVISSGNGAGIVSANQTLVTQPASMKANTFIKPQFNSYTGVGGIGPAVLFDSSSSGGIGGTVIVGGEAELYNNPPKMGTLTDDSNAESSSYVVGLTTVGFHDESATSVAAGGPVLLLNGIYSGASLNGEFYANGTPSFTPLQFPGTLFNSTVQWAESFGSPPGSLVSGGNCTGSSLRIAAAGGTGACGGAVWVIDSSAQQVNASAIRAAAYGTVIDTNGNLTENCAGVQPLTAGAATVTNACLTASTNAVVCTDQTANVPVKCTPQTGSLAITGTGTDIIAWARLK